MADIVLEVVKTLAEWSWNPVTRGLSYTFHYKRNISSLNLEVDELEKLHNDYQPLVEAARESGDAIRPDLNKWLTDAQKAIADVRGMKNEAEEGKRCFCRWCPDLKWRYSLGKRAVGEATTINKLLKDGKFETISIPVPPRPIEIQATMSSGDIEVFGSTSHVMDKIMEALKDNKVSIIGLHGMGGIGKTTMAKQVGAQARKDGLFDCVVMAVLSQAPNFKNIQGELADGLGIKLEAESEMGRAGELKKRIMGGKRTLIILDDIWNEIDLSRIGVPGQGELPGCPCKVLLTTRVLSVCNHMNSQTNIPLNILSEQDSWTLFVRKARRSFDSTDFCNVAKQVCSECKGLPIALVVVAKTLGDKDIQEWKAAAQRLQMSQIANPEEDKGDVSKCIRFSYDFLNTDDAKSCFLLCCLFPEDSYIKIEDLMKYGFGKGLFQDADTIEKARVRARSVAKYLIACSLLLDSTVDGYVRMHDVIRDTAISIAKSEDGRGFLVKAGCGLVNWPKSRHGEADYSAISLMRNDISKLSDELVCTHLQILLLQENDFLNEIPETFFQSPNAIRVLDLSDTSISLLPHSFSLLSNLHALHLDGCEEITNLSLLGGLARLEMLSMRAYRGHKLPKEIGQLINLRMLDLTRSWVTEIPSKVISKLGRLEELYLHCRFEDWGSKVEGSEEETNVGFDELSGLSDLKIVEVTLSDAECLNRIVGFSLNWIKSHICIATIPFKGRDILFSKDCSRTLTLGVSINTLPDWFVSEVREKAMKLVYHKYEGLNNILVENDHGRLQELKHLAVIDCPDNLDELMNAITWVPNKPVFENLEELHLRKLKSLKKLCVGELPPGSLCNLMFLKVKECSQLSNTLLPRDLLKRLQKLKTLVCVDAENLEYVFGSEGLEPEEQTVLRDLEVIVLGSLPELTNIWNGPAPNKIFHNLKTFMIGGCRRIKYVFTIHVARCLLQLEDLVIDGCYELVRVIEPSETTKDKVVFPQLKNLGFRDLRKLTSVDIECPMLENLFFQDCGFEECSTFVSDFRSTKQVRVHDADSMRELRKKLDLLLA